MATACLNQNGNSAGTSNCKFHVCAQLGYGTRYNFGYPMYRRYYVQVTKGQSSNFTSNLKVSWTSTTYALNVAGSYASTGWVSLGNKTCGTSVSLDSVNCYYTGDSGTTYKSTSSAGSWTVPKATHTVAYNANGGSGAPASQTKTYGAVLTLSSTKPTRTGYTFKGWSTSSTATSATYSAGGQYSADQWGGTVTLYAVWKINTYTNSITHWLWGFTNGEGTNTSGTAYQLSTTSFSANYNASVTVNTAKGITPPNGCYLSSSCVTSGLADSWVNYTMPYTYNQPAKAITWQYDYHPTTYTITYNMNNGTNNSANPSSYNVLYGVTFANPTREYYNFKNWTNASGTVVTGINPGANATFTSASDLTTKLASRTVGNQTITANWTPWTHTVTYNGNATGVTNLPANQTKTYGSTITIPSGTSGTPVRAGYLFQGWATTPTGPVVYQPGGTYSADQNGGTVTLYAVWLVATKITMTLSDVTSGYNITNTSAGKAVLSALNIPFTLGTVTENASLKFYYHPYYIDKNGTKKYFSTDPIGGQTPTAMGNKGTLTLSGDNVKAYILATENYDYITIGVDTYTAEITEDTKGSAGPYNYAVYINNYTPVYVDVLNVYRPTDSSIVVKIEIEFPSCYSGIASTTYPQLYFNSSAITTAPTSASVNGTIGTYIYNLTGLSGAGTFKASFNDGLTAMTSVKEIAASTANQRFSVEEDTVYALEFIEVGKEGISNRKSINPVTYYVETYTGERVAEMKSEYPLNLYATNYTKPKIKYNLVYRNDDGSVTIKVRVTFSKSFTNMDSKKSTIRPTLKCNNNTLSITPTITKDSSETNTYIYEYKVPSSSAKGHSVVSVSYSDGLFEAEASAHIAKDKEDQVFKILRSGAARAMAFEEETGTKGMKILKDGRVYGNAFSEQIITYS